MQIRPARTEDAEIAIPVIRRSIVELCHAHHAGDAERIARWLANKTPEHFRNWLGSSHILLASECTAVLGVAAMTDTGTVTLNYVSPDARFRGVSKALLAALEDRARQLGLDRVTLESTLTAHRFYRTAGFLDHAPSTTEPGLWMSKTLADKSIPT